MQSMYLEAIDSRKEIDTLHDLVKMVWTQYYGPIMGEGKVERFLATKQSKAQIQKEISQGLVAYYFIRSQDSKEIIGYTAYHETKSALVIDKLYLTYTMRGQGLSHEIVSYFEEEAARLGLSEIEIWINHENQMGIDIFKHFGFKAFSSRRTPIDQGYVLVETGLVKND